MFTPELNALILCSRARLEDEGKHTLERILRRSPDWSLLLGLAKRHHMTCLLFHHIDGSFPDITPEDVRNSLSATFKKNAIKNLFLTKEMLKLLEIFNNAGIDAMPLKGPALAYEAYGDPALREFSDLDILLRPRDALKAKDILLHNGYRAQLDIPKSMERTYYDREYYLNFQRDDRKVSVDLHWGAFPPAYSFSPPCELFFSNTRQIKIAGATITAPSEENLVLFTALHGTKHLWEQLNWLCDLGAVLRNAEENAVEIDWKAVMTSASELNASRMVSLGLHLANEFLGAPVPENLLDEIKRDSKIKYLSRRIFSSFSRETRPYGFLERHSLYMTTMENLSDRARYAAELVFKPTQNDWRSIHFPEGMEFFYYPYRPLRLALKHLRSLATRITA